MKRGRQGGAGELPRLTAADERGLVGKILLIWLLILALVVIGLIDGASILLARWRVGDLARDSAVAAAERLGEGGRRRAAARAARDEIARVDEDAELVAFDVSERGDVTVEVRDEVGTILVGRFGLLDELTSVTASDTVASD